MDVSLVRTALGFVVYPQDTAGAAYVAKLKPGTVLASEIRQPRNVKFHKKFFALLRLAYDYWSETMPQMDYMGEQVRPEFERFRRDLVILSGHYEPVFSIDGRVKLHAKSISFSSMDEEEFNRVYNDVLDTVLARIMKNVSKQELEAAVEQVMAFA